MSVLEQVSFLTRAVFALPRVHDFALHIDQVSLGRLQGKNQGVSLKSGRLVELHAEFGFGLLCRLRPGWRRLSIGWRYRHAQYPYPKGDSSRHAYGCGPPYRSTSAPCHEIVPPGLECLRIHCIWPGSGRPSSIPAKPCKGFRAALSSYEIGTKPFPTVPRKTYLGCSVSAFSSEPDAPARNGAASSLARRA